MDSVQCLSPDFRDAVFERAMDHLADNEWNVFIYYPPQGTVVLPEAAAKRLCTETVFRRDGTKRPPIFIRPADLPRFNRLFEQIAEGSDCVSEAFVGSNLYSSFTVSIYAARRAPDGTVTLAFGQLIPLTIQNANSLFSVTSQANTPLALSDDKSTDPMLRLARGLTGQYYAIYHLNLTASVYTCYQDSTGDFPAIAGMNGKLTEAVALYISTMAHPEDRERLTRFADLTTLAERLRHSDSISLTYRRTGRGWSRGTFIVIRRNPDGTPSDLLYVISDVSNEMTGLPAQPDASRLDPVTGLRNRRVLEDMVSSPANYETDIGVLHFEAEEFDSIVERFGREGADHLLKRAGMLMTALFRQRDYVLRTGEAAFTVILQRCEETAAWPALCRKLELLAAGLRRQLPDNSPFVLSAGLVFSRTGYSPALLETAVQGAAHTRHVGARGCTLMTADGKVTAFWRVPGQTAAVSPERRSLLEAAMASLLKNTGFFAWIKDRDQTFAAASESFAVRLSGCARADDIIGKSDADLCADPALAETYRRETEAQLADGTDLTVRRETLTDRDGDRIFCETNRYLLRDADGTPAGILGIGREITESSKPTLAASANDRLGALLSKIYFAACSVNLEHGTLTPYHLPPLLEQVIGSQSGLAQCARLGIDAMVAPAFREKMVAFYDPETLSERLRNTGHIEADYINKQTGRWQCSHIIEAARNAAGELTEVLLLLSELDEHAAAERRATLENRRYLKEIFAHTPDGLALYRYDGHQVRTLFISDFLKQAYGRDLTDTIYRVDPEIIHPDDLAGYVAARRLFLTSGKPLDHTFRVKYGQDKVWRWFRANAVARLQPDGSQLLFTVYSDVTDLKEREAHLQYLNEHDPLTGLWNRTRVYAACRKLMREHPEAKFAMMHFDIRQFRLYNTFFGEKEGDRLLCDLADLFRGMSPDYEYWAYGRVEGDVFCLFFPIEAQKYQAHLDALLTCLRNYREDCLIEPAIGIYAVTDPDMPPEAMFARATIAAKATQSGTERVVMFYTDAMEAEVAATRLITNEMPAALSGRQFEVWLQPKVSLETGKTAGAEALVRWRHPTRGMIRPDNFIPVCEKNGFITHIDRYMWEAVCRLLRERLDAGKPPVPVSVNISRISMYSRTTVPYLKTLVTKYGIEPRYLELELTESALMDDPAEMKRQLEELRAFGFRILIDDFGKGQSSLNTIRDLPVDVLKLDIGFLPKDQNDTAACAVAAAVLAMARRLGLSVIAEGVETEAQAQFLREERCPCAQGYLYARPMPVADFEAKLAAELEAA